MSLSSEKKPKNKCHNTMKHFYDFGLKIFPNFITETNLNYLPYLLYTNNADGGGFSEFFIKKNNERMTSC